MSDTRTAAGGQMPDTTQRVPQAGIARAGNERPSGGIALSTPAASQTPRTDEVLSIENNWGAVRDAVGGVMDGVTPDEAHNDMVHALTRLARELERENITMARALCEIDARILGMQFLDEALNSGDGVYRP